MPLPRRRVRLFRIDGDQAVEIPRDFELPGKFALMQKVGRHLVLRATPGLSLLKVLETLPPLNEEFPQISDPPPG